MGRFFTQIELTLWPKVSVVVFLVVFLAIVVWTIWLSSSRVYDRAARLPLEDD